MQTCEVSVEDFDKVVHTVRVQADSLFEAVGLGLAAIEKRAWTGQIAKGLNIVTVRITEVTEHAVRIADFDKWLNRTGGSPREIVQKQKIQTRLLMIL